MEGRAHQDTERNGLSGEHSLSGDGSGMDLSGDGNKKDQVSGAHYLETADRGQTCQDTEIWRQSDAYSQTVDAGRGRNLSGHRKKASVEVAPTD